MSYFSVVIGKILCAYRILLQILLQSHIESYSLHLLLYKSETENWKSSISSVIKAASGGVTFDVGLQKYPRKYAKSFLGQQKSNPQI